MTPAQYKPDALLFDPPEFNRDTGFTVTKPPRSQVPRFDGNPRKWPGFIDAFRVLIHNTRGNDMERLSHLQNFPVPEFRNVIGDSLGNPGLYQKTLCHLQETYGNPRAVAAACSTGLKSLQSFKDGDPVALKKFSMSLRFIVSTLEAVGYDGELYTNSTLQSSATNRQILAVGLRAACPTFLTSTNGLNRKQKRNSAFG